MIFRVLAPVIPRAASRAPSRMVGVARDVIALGKPRITALVLFTATVGFVLAPGACGAARLCATLVGLGLVVAGANALNMWAERDVDARMARTADRPLPAGRLDPATALALGLAWSAAGLAVLSWRVNAAAAALAGFGLASYVLAYTPLKRVTPWALEVGAVPGAVSTLVGWAAATGGVGAPGLALFAILFFWQMPHFLALALHRRDEYARAGLRVWPVVAGEAATRRQIAAYTAALVAASAAPFALGATGALYLAAAAALGAAFLAGALRRSVGPRALFLYSLAYLPALLAALVADAVVW